MERDELFKLVDAILNKTSDADLEVIHEALKRRERAGDSTRQGGISPERIARESSRQMAEQMSYSRDSIRAMVQKFAADIIKQNAPELSDEQVHELLDEWVPDPESQQQKQKQEKGKKLPGDVLITMARQFISYAEGKMPPSEQAKLHEEIPDWHKSYWEWFPQRIREAVALYLKDVINEDDCWEQIYDEAEGAGSD